MHVQSLANIWGPLDDVVMGGVSESGFQVRAGSGEQGQPAGIFSGNVSSSNNGGFASVSWEAMPTGARHLDHTCLQSNTQLNIYC